MIKTAILIAFAIILFTLGRGLVALLKGQNHSRQLVKALTWRIALSIGLLLMLVLAQQLGLIQPHALLPPLQ